MRSNNSAATPNQRNQSQQRPDREPLQGTLGRQRLRRDPPRNRPQQRTAFLGQAVAGNAGEGSGPHRQLQYPQLGSAARCSGWWVRRRPQYRASCEPATWTELHLKRGQRQCSQEGQLQAHHYPADQHHDQAHGWHDHGAEQRVRALPIAPDNRPVIRAISPVTGPSERDRTPADGQGLAAWPHPPSQRHRP